MSLAGILAITIVLTSGSQQFEESCRPELEDQYLTDLRDDELRLTDAETLLHSIECVGQLKSIAAVNPLVELLEFRRAFWWDGTGAVPRLIVLIERYPAGRALAAIGEASLASVLKVISEEDPDSLRARVASGVIDRIFLRDPPNGLALLRRSLIVAKTEDERMRFQRKIIHYARVNGLSIKPEN